MKNNVFILLVFIFVGASFAQDSKLSVELNYPIPIGDNFIKTNYDGIIDVGINYRFIKANLMHIGASINGGIMTSNFGTTLYNLQPRVFSELNLKSLPKIHPSIGIGYTFMFFNNSDSDFSLTDNQHGINLNLGFAYNIAKKFFAKIQYDFVKLNAEDRFLDSTFNTTINILKIGVGYRL